MESQTFRRKWVTCPQYAAPYYVKLSIRNDTLVIHQKSFAIGLYNIILCCNPQSNGLPHICRAKWRPCWKASYCQRTTFFTPTQPHYPNCVWMFEWTCTQKNTHETFSFKTLTRCDALEKRAPGKFTHALCCTHFQCVCTCTNGTCSNVLIFLFAGKAAKLCKQGACACIIW